jgi:hypothetical protein
VKALVKPDIEAQFAAFENVRDVAESHESASDPVDAQPSDAPSRS